MGWCFTLFDNSQLRRVVGLDTHSNPVERRKSRCALKRLLFRYVIMPPPEDIETSRVAASAMRHLFPRLGPIQE